MHRLDLLALAGPGQKDRVDPGLLIRLDALLRFADAPTAERARAADDDQRGILARRHGTPELPQHFFDGHQAFPAHQRAMAAPCLRWSAPRRRRSRALPPCA